jgi:hypothetical protein
MQLKKFPGAAKCNATMKGSIVGKIKNQQQTNGKKREAENTHVHAYCTRHSRIFTFPFLPGSKMYCHALVAKS